MNNDDVTAYQIRIKDLIEQFLGEADCIENIELLVAFLFGQAVLGIQHINKISENKLAEAINKESVGG